MIRDFCDLDSGNTPKDFQADIAIVGAGAAGITLARECSASGLDVLLIESGGHDYKAEVQDLYHGFVSGIDYYELRESRLRFFGGTTAIWGGRCAQLDPIDFEHRPWLKHSGWPFQKDAIQEYYARAQEALDLPVVDHNAMPSAPNPFKDLGDKARTDALYWQFDEQFSRFTLASCRDLQESDRVTILLNANVVGIQTSENGKTVSALTIRNLNLQDAVIQARYYILATGGLENPRLLLASRTPSHPQGIGNHNDQVGRYFMEHPHGRVGHVTTDNPKAFFEHFRAYQRDQKGFRYGMLLRPTQKMQAEEQILNTCFTVSVYPHPGEKRDFYKSAYSKIKHDMEPSAFGRGLWRIVKKASRWFQDHRGPSIKSRLLKNKRYGIYAVARAEQAPNPDSRVRLVSEKDKLGVPKIDLDWQMLAIDKFSLNRAVQSFDQDLQALNLGQITPQAWLSDSKIDWEFDDLVTSHVMGGYHHMGTTRMGTDPQSSVVDPNGCVHGMENLYIAGSSVFPTSGWANPTLTILALSFRLAKHIITQCQK